MKEFRKIKLRKLKNNKIKKTVNSLVKKNFGTSKSYSDWRKDILRGAANFCGISEKGQRQKATWLWKDPVKKSINEKRFLH